MSKIFMLPPNAMGFFIICPPVLWSSHGFSPILSPFPTTNSDQRPGVGPVHLILLELLLPFARHLTLQLKAVLEVPAGIGVGIRSHHCKEAMGACKKEIQLIFGVADRRMQISPFLRQNHSNHDISLTKNKPRLGWFPVATLIYEPPASNSSQHPHTPGHPPIPLSLEYAHNFSTLKTKD